jgi:ADP-ribosyl-[dinitrogen reductase] hydrolase
MIGAIAGDIIGSRFEFNNLKSKDFELFHSDCRFTDDTVLTVAVAEWLMDGADLPELFLKWYIRCGRHRSYGGMFERWLLQWKKEPYNSFGNGAAMRVSACAWAKDDLASVLDLAKQSAEVTHNHPEGIKGAQATAHAILMARQGNNAQSIRDAISGTYGYDLSESVDDIREWYYFNETCQGTVPQAVICALEAVSFEDAIRNAISIGGDSDTVAAITGSIAEGLFGVPDEVVEKARSYLSGEIIEVLDRFAEGNLTKAIS